MAFHKMRVGRIKSEMEKFGLEVLVLFKPQYTYYVSGDNAIVYARPYIVVLPFQGEPVLIVELLREDRARENSKIRDIRVYHKHRLLEVLQGMATDPLELLKEVLAEKGFLKAKLGIDMDYVPARMFQQLKDLVTEASFSDATALLDKVRMVKDEEEIQMLKIACEISDVGMETAVDAIRERGREIDVAVAAQKAMLEFWENNYPDYEAADLSIEDGTIWNHLWCSCMSGNRSFSRPPSPTQIQTGDVVWLIVSVAINCLHASNERTVVVGRPSNKQKRACEAVLEAQKKAVEILRAGVRASDVNRAAAEVIQSAGYSEHVKSRAGHGVGLGGHELPSLSEEDDTVLKPGMTIAVEPGFRSPFGIYQNSDTVLVTKNEPEFLTKYNSQHSVLWTEEKG